MIKIVEYQSELKEKWNAFIKLADNSNFLFDRNFMDYHSDRFKDSSVLIYEDELLVGVFPANIENGVIYSHQGLTYGGLILNERKNVKKLINYFISVFSYYQNKGIHEMYYKPVPNYISKTVNDLEHFVLNIVEAQVVRIDTSFVIDLTQELKFQERRRRSIKKGEKSGTEIKLDNSFESFWNKVLLPNLEEKFGAKPVHSLAEIQLLHSRFPEKITQANAYINGEIVAGVTLMDFDGALHCQYISSNDFGRDSGAIDLLFNNLINSNKANKHYFSLGTANNNGNSINFGLTEWKEGWGAKIHSHFYYKFKIENINKLINLIP